MILRPGSVVRMTAACREQFIRGGSGQHVLEFGHCAGVVVADLGHGDWDVRWAPSGLRYGYRSEQLEPVPYVSHVQFDLSWDVAGIDHSLLDRVWPLVIAACEQQILQQCSLSYGSIQYQCSTPQSDEQLYQSIYAIIGGCTSRQMRVHLVDSEQRRHARKQS